MKKTLKVLAVIMMVVMTVTIGCGCTDHKENVSTEKLTLSDPNEKIIEEDIWYEAYLVSPEGNLSYRGSIDKENFEEKIEELVAQGYTIYQSWVD